ncbi:hypothetical protein FACS189492_3050 [Clostridia bacterium]|nr:hypothetical protein FACS189492_3050 [Clostridia bacterium]
MLNSRGRTEYPFAIIALLLESEPKTWASVTDENMWDGARLNGKICMLPNFNGVNVWFNTITYREDLRRKYNAPEIKSFSDFEAYFDVL